MWRHDTFLKRPGLGVDSIVILPTRRERVGGIVSCAADSGDNRCGTIGWGEDLLSLVPRKSTAGFNFMPKLGALRILTLPGYLTMQFELRGDILADDDLGNDQGPGNDRKGRNVVEAIRFPHTIL